MENFIFCAVETVSENSETVKIFSQILTFIETVKIENGKNCENVFTSYKIYENRQIIFANSKIFKNDENI